MEGVRNADLIQQLLPSGAKNKPGRSMTPKYITMHNTGNTSKGADARAHASYLSSGASGQKVSWHYTVDDEVIYQHLWIPSRAGTPRTAEGRATASPLELRYA